MQVYDIEEGGNLGLHPVGQPPLRQLATQRGHDNRELLRIPSDYAPMVDEGGKDGATRPGWGGGQARDIIATAAGRSTAKPQMAAVSTMSANVLWQHQGDYYLRIGRAERHP